uniref:B30.2/SPRY domain-containing protein n=1 Tax=Globodera rostochiensis TaxID=31243 RepID=A0A914HU11_GLORO
MAMSTESTNVDNITTDQEHLSQTVANLAFEELRFLHAQIAQLECQQAMNSPTSSASFDLLAQDGNEQQQNALHEKVLKLEMYQKEQQLYIVDLQKKVAMLSDTINGKAPIPQQNRWDSAACDKYLAISGSDQSIVQYTEKAGGKDRSVFAIEPVPKCPFGIFYYEIKMFGEEPCSFGLATKRMHLKDAMVGAYKGTYAYESDGTFWGHDVDGCSFYNRRSGPPYVKGKPSFGVGDVVGCGVNLITRQIIYTKNGQRLDTADMFLGFNDEELFTCVTLTDVGTKIEANFGPYFEYKFC